MLKLSIKGRYWDSLLTSFYSEDSNLQLALVGLDGSVRFAHWTKILNSLPVPAQLKPLMLQALSLNGFQWMSFPIEAFRALVELNLETISEHLKDATISLNLFENGRKLLPFPYSDIYLDGKIFIGTSSGIYMRSFLGRSARKISDVPGFGFAQSNRVMVAAGTEGLFKIEPNFKVSQVSNKPCDTCVGSVVTPLVAATYKGKSLYVVDSSTSKEHTVVNRDGLHWAAGLNGLVLYNYLNETISTTCLRTDNSFKNFGERLAPWFEGYKFVSAQASDFGSVIELEDMVLVLTANEILKFPGEVTRVRVYTGQLHLIYSDRVEIVFFPRLPHNSLGFGRLPLLSSTDEAILGL